MLLRSGSVKIEGIEVNGGRKGQKDIIAHQDLDGEMPSTSTLCIATTSTAGKGSSKDKNQGNLSLSQLSTWEELIEDFDIAIENSKDVKHVENRGDITPQVMSSYGMEFLGLISEIVFTAAEKRIQLPELLEQLKSIKFNKPAVTRGKLIVWVDDQPIHEGNQANDKMVPLCQVLLTELLRLKIEPEIVIPCQDFDPDILEALVHQVGQNLTPEQCSVYGTKQSHFERGVLLELLRIGLTISLASATTEIIIIDADEIVDKDPNFLSLLEMAEKLGHTVMYFRNSDTISDKTKATEEFVEQMKVWFQKMDRSMTHAAMEDEERSRN